MLKYYMKLHLGCGTHFIEGWVNIDYNLGARLAKIPPLRLLVRKANDWDRRIMIHDLRQKLPFTDQTVDCIYTSHTLEHLTRKAGRQLLSESYRVLKSGGVMRIVVPDLKTIVENYMEGKIKADEFLDNLLVHYVEEHDTRLRTLLAPLMRFPHQCMYDEPRLLQIMSDIGFWARAMRPFESEIENIREIEKEDRTLDAVIVEGKKP